MCCCFKFRFYSLLDDSNSRRDMQKLKYPCDVSDCQTIQATKMFSFARPQLNDRHTQRKRRFILHNTHTIALNNDRNKTQSGGLSERHKAHLSWPSIVKNKFCYCRGTARRATLVEKLWPFLTQLLTRSSANPEEPCEHTVS